MRRDHRRKLKFLDANYPIGTTQCLARATTDLHPKGAFLACLQAQNQYMLNKHWASAVYLHPSFLFFALPSPFAALVATCSENTFKRFISFSYCAVSICEYQNRQLVRLRLLLEPAVHIFRPRRQHLICRTRVCGAGNV